MTRVAGPSLDQLDRLGDDYAGLVAEALAKTARRAGAADATNVTVPEDLATLRTIWAVEVEGVLLPALGVAFEVGAAHIRVGLREAVGLTAAAFTDVAPTSDALSEQYLTQARNRLVGVGDELWAHAREELLEGLQTGESVPELAARVRKVAPDLTEPRAEAIARSEVMGAVNAGTLEQVWASGATGTKEWVSGHDTRVRPEHEHADNQTVGLREFFTVGGFPMQRPHDPAGPPHLTVNCRCALSFDLDLEIGDPAGLPTGSPAGEAPTEVHEDDDSPGVRQRQERRAFDDRFFLRRVFADGLAALVGWFKARTAAATLQGDHTFEGGTVTADASQPVEHFHYRMAEGVSTGLRTFAANAITWREPPFAFMWQKMIPETGGHGLAVQAGLITRAERSGAEIDFYGPLDLNSEDGLEYARRLVEGFARWGSVSPDENKVDVEVVWADGASEEEMLLGGEPEQYVFHSFNVAELTALSVPALADATIEPTPALLEELERRGALPEGVKVSRSSGCDTCQEPEALAAAGYSITIEDIPPASWFEEPTEEPAIGAITVTDEGRVFGYLAPGGVAHLGHRRNGHTIYAPMNTVDYDDKFLNKPALVRTASGQVEKIPAGNITAECGHAPIRRSNSRVAPDHYDNSCSVVARIRVGENERGVWAAGALQPGVTADQVSRMFACQLSGDWQQHEKLTSYDELVAALLVPVPGFPKAQPASVRIRDGHLVASAVPVRYQETESRTDLSKVKQRVARSIGRDSKSRKAAVAARVKARG